ncbi:hypothetical protein, unlikely [Trypanosoma brucei gambiense DAL972]|uniref:Uncharacterized protein n=1 Tax=Trypanosoma brucei gambiense (strain MHOM/CI/86/DAL972) TaxID=679716 RepID=C9ZLV2_TRYB9|nr:hypothetical protein, unlikely [Trypanosoma brucei gambiense DAL972]CBH10377.1 hypothetical protein, unlikely [Trypanosoma brucei gambiense DAL972]|eukprot:XP_011772667.1 hypothetical protein, unlikely [Trypanosoma brucei gambiense DAL972]
MFQKYIRQCGTYFPFLFFPLSVSSSPLNRHGGAYFNIYIYMRMSCLRLLPHFSEANFPSKKKKILFKIHLFFFLVPLFFLICFKQLAFFFSPCFRLLFFFCGFSLLMLFYVFICLFAPPFSPFVYLLLANIKQNVFAQWIA